MRGCPGTESETEREIVCEFYYLFVIKTLSMLCCVSDHESLRLSLHDCPLMKRNVRVLCAGRGRPGPWN